MNTSPAVKIFIWKAAHTILPNSMRMTVILPDINTICNVCTDERETLTHLFLYCRYAKEVCMHFNFDMHSIKNGTNNFHDWLTNCFETTDRG